MAKIRQEFIKATLIRVYESKNNLDKRYEIRKQIISNHKPITKDEAMRLLNKYYDYMVKIKKKEFVKIVNKCLAKSYCEICIQNHLKTKFPN
jgi:hypothetical protein